VHKIAEKLIYQMLHRGTVTLSDLKCQARLAPGALPPRAPYSQPPSAQTEMLLTDATPSWLKQFR